MPSEPCRTVFAVVVGWRWIPLSAILPAWPHFSNQAKISFIWASDCSAVFSAHSASLPAISMANFIGALPLHRRRRVHLTPCRTAATTTRQATGHFFRRGGDRPGDRGGADRRRPAVPHPSGGEGRGGGLGGAPRGAPARAARGARRGPGPG